MPTQPNLFPTPPSPSDLVRNLTRCQVSAVLYDVARIGHYTFDKTHLLKKWLRQAIRFGSVKRADLRRYMRSSMKHHWRNSTNRD